MISTLASPTHYRRLNFSTACICGLLLAASATGRQEPLRCVSIPNPSSTQIQITRVNTSQFPQVSIFPAVLKDGEPAPDGDTNAIFRIRADRAKETAVFEVETRTNQ